MERGIITAIALNGAGIIHDSEIALVGHTSEDVSREIVDGSFGMAAETAQVINSAIKEGVKRGWGIGESVGKKLLDLDLPFNDVSILAAGARLNIPITVHVAVGTDIIHMHPSCDGSAVGEGSYRDFRLFSSIISQLDQGVYLNIGSAVILPEVFLKAFNLVKNLGHKIDKFTTVNLDFVRHYRPLTNVVNRPQSCGGKGYNITGHHEIMLPLLAAAVIEELEEGSSRE